MNAHGSPVRLEALETLDAIDRHGSFAAAAASLYRVPSAISYTISQLESDLGITVFDRSGHRAVLTPAGRLLLEEGRRILTASRELGAAAKRLADNWEPELRLALNGLIAPSELWPAVADFHRAHPAIGVADPPGKVGVHRAPFKPVTFVFCCAPNHPLAAQEQPLTEDMLRIHRAVVVADSAQALAPRSAGLLDGQPRLTVASMHSKIDAIEQGLGVGHCPAAWVRKPLEDGRLVACELATAREPHPSYLLWKSTTNGRALRWFIDRLST